MVKKGNSRSTSLRKSLEAAMDVDSLLYAKATAPGRRMIGGRERTIAHCLSTCSNWPKSMWRGRSH